MVQEKCALVNVNAVAGAPLPSNVRLAASDPFPSLCGLRRFLGAGAQRVQAQAISWKCALFVREQASPPPIAIAARARVLSNSETADMRRRVCQKFLSRLSEKKKK